MKRRMLLVLSGLLPFLGVSEGYTQGSVVDYRDKVLRRSWSPVQAERIRSNSYSKAMIVAILEGSVQAPVESGEVPRPETLARLSRFDRIIERYSEQYAIDPNLIKAMIYVESRGRTRSVSPKGALGLMQIMPATASAIGVNNPFDPEENIAGGTKLLRYMLEKFENIGLALWAYNAGPGALRKGRLPQQTLQYILRVLSVRRYLASLHKAKY